jgi:hypothetical protein
MAARPSVLALALLVLLPRAAGAGEDPAPIPGFEQAESVRQRYLRISMGGRHAGGVGQRLGRLPDGRLLYEERVVARLSRSLGEAVDEFRIETRARRWLAADGSLLGSEHAMEEAGVALRVRCRYEEGRVRVVSEGPGGTYRNEFALPDDHASDLQVFRALVRALEAGGEAKRTYRAFDALQLAFEPVEATLLGREAYLHDGTTHAAWRLRRKRAGLVDDALVDGDLLAYSSVALGGMMRAEWVNEPPFEVEGPGWSVSSLLEVDRGVERPLELERLELDLTLDPAPAPGEPPAFEDDPYQAVARTPSGLRLTLRHGRPPEGFRPPPLPVATEDPEVARFLAPTPSAQSDHEAIVARALTIVDGAPDALAAVRAIVGWVWSHVAKESGARGAATALEVLESLQGDCTEHATLTVALCRAAGIPARAVAGLVYLTGEGGEGFAGFHAWAEVWLGRWIPVDATIPEVGTSARYARLEVSEPGEPSRAGRVLALLAGKARIRVLGWKRFGEEPVVLAEPAAAR